MDTTETLLKGLAPLPSLELKETRGRAGEEHVVQSHNKIGMDETVHGALPLL